MVKQRFQVLFRRWLFTVMKSGRADPVIRGFCVGPAAPSLRAPQHFGFADGSTFCPPAHGSAVLAVGIRGVVMVQTAQVTRFLERATAMLQKLLGS